MRFKVMGIDAMTRKVLSKQDLERQIKEFGGTPVCDIVCTRDIYPPYSLYTKIHACFSMCTIVLVILQTTFQIDEL